MDAMISCDTLGWRNHVHLHKNSISSDWQTDFQHCAGQIWRQCLIRGMSLRYWQSLMAELQFNGKPNRHAPNLEAFKDST